MNENKKEKKAFYKRWWFWAIAIVFIIIIASSGGSDNPSSTTNNTGGESKSVTQSDKVFGLKDEAPAGDLVFTVNSVSKKKTIGSGYFAKTSQSGTFVVANVTVKNNGNETITIDSSLFDLEDGQGRSFDRSTEGQTAVSLDGNESFFLKQVQPGLSATGDIVFEVPEDASGLKMIVRPSVFSGKTATVELE